jgi:hypothetical protein
VNKNHYNDLVLIWLPVRNDIPYLVLR